MSRRNSLATRVHLIAHANPLGTDAARFGLDDVGSYVAFAERSLPKTLRLSYNAKLLGAVEEPWLAGRTDDAGRVRDLNSALADGKTSAIVAAGGGAYFSRILPELDFGPLSSRRTPLWFLGFSEMSTIANVIASYRCGRALYWLCPNWMAWQIRPEEAARAALAEFWRVLPEVIAGRVPEHAYHLVFAPVDGELVRGKAKSGMIRIVGGCLAVLAAFTGSPLAKRVRPDGKWLLLEDIKESPYRIDRHLAALKLAGWFERVAGLLIGDFHMMHKDTQGSVLELLKYHLPADCRIPVVTTRAVGHVWPMVPVMLNRPVPLSIQGRAVTIAASGLRGAE